MSFLGYATNEHNIPISRHLCDTCGEKYTVCPPAENLPDWGNCLADGCASYDPHRDGDILFMSNEEIAQEKKLVSINKLRERKNE